MTRNQLLNLLDAYGRDFDRWDRPDHRTHKATIGPFTITVTSHRDSGSTWTVEHTEHGILKEDQHEECVSYCRIAAILYSSQWTKQHVGEHPAHIC